MPKRRELLALAERVPGAWIGIKIAVLLLLVEGRRPGLIAEVLSLTRMSFSRWIHAVDEQGVDSLPATQAGASRGIDRQGAA
jgi:transposase